MNSQTSPRVIVDDAQGDPPLRARIAAYGLAGSSSVLPTGPLAPDDWQRLHTEVRLGRLTGLLIAAIAAGEFPADPEQHDQAIASHAESMQIAVILERLLLETVALLRDADVEVRVLKGPSLAHTIYPDPSLRPFGDIDLLVHSDDFERATAVLVGAGAIRMYPELRPGFDRRFGKGVTLIRPNHLQIDLHRTFVSGRYGLAIRLDDLFATGTTFVVGGTELVGLGPEERLLHACYHAAIGDPAPRMISLRDIAQCLRTTDVDQDRVLELARRWRGEGVLARGIQLAWDALALSDVEPLSVWAGRYQPDGRERRAIEGYTTSRSFTAQTLSALPAVPGIRSKVAMLRALVFPDRRFLERKRKGRFRWLRRGLRSFRRSGH